MAENKRVRIEPHIEDYLRLQSQRVLDKPGDKLSVAELSTLVNTIVYEHKLAHSMARQIPLARLFNWLMGLVPGSGNKVIAMQSDTSPVLEPSKTETLDFEADFANQFEVDLERVA